MIGLIRRVVQQLWPKTTFPTRISSTFPYTENIMPNLHISSLLRPSISECNWHINGWAQDLQIISFLKLTFSVIHQQTHKYLPKYDWIREMAMHTLQLMGLTNSNILKLAFRKNGRIPLYYLVSSTLATIKYSSNTLESRMFLYKIWT
jgi:hypothetical protein